MGRLLAVFSRQLRCGGELPCHPSCICLAWVCADAEVMSLHATPLASVAAYVCSGAEVASLNAIPFAPVPACVGADAEVLSLHATPLASFSAYACTDAEVARRACMLPTTLPSLSDCLSGLESGATEKYFSLCSSHAGLSKPEGLPSGGVMGTPPTSTCLTELANFMNAFSSVARGECTSLKGIKVSSLLLFLAQVSPGFSLNLRRLVGWSSQSELLSGSLEKKGSGPAISCLYAWASLSTSNCEFRSLS